MNLLTKLAFAGLAIALVANGDTAAKSSSNAGSTIDPLSVPVNGWSGWASMPLARDQGSVVSLNEKKAFHDTQFEYRWKPQGKSDACTVEFRDVDNSHTVREINVFYSDSRHHRQYTGHHILIGKRKHVHLTLTECERVELVFWKK